MPKYSVTVCYDCSSGTTLEADNIEAASQAVHSDPNLTAIPTIEKLDVGDAYKVIITDINDPAKWIEINV